MSRHTWYGRKKMQPRNSQNQFDNTNKNLLPCVYHVYIMCVHGHAAAHMRKRSKSNVSYTHILAHRLQLTFFLLYSRVLFQSLLLTHPITRSLIQSFYLNFFRRGKVEQRQRYSIKFFCIFTGKHGRHSSHTHLHKAKNCRSKCVPKLHTHIHKYVRMYMYRINK